MNLRRRLLEFVVALAIAGQATAAERISVARYEKPVDRYGHFALGRPHEYARLTVTTDAGRSVGLQLPEDEVFEDLAPRLVHLIPGDPGEILSVVSRRDSGARLVLFRLAGGELAMSAQSPAIGMANRWLNPVGIADLDGDGRAEIAAVITPHIGGILKVYRRRGADLVEIAALAGFSNHVYGTAELALSTPLAIGGRMRLLVPDAQRNNLRIIALEQGRLVESGRCALSSPIVGAIALISPREISVGLVSGRRSVTLDGCRNQAARE